MSHNPENIEDYGQSDGWRLLDWDEVSYGYDANPVMLDEIESYSPGWGWLKRFYGTNAEMTFRTKLTKPELRKARNMPPL